MLVPTVAATTSFALLLFWDLEPIDDAGLRNGAELTLNKPQKLGRVLKPEHPWEAAELGGYDTVLKVADGDYRFYYLCNSDWRMTPQRTCLARSRDGKVWSKPALHAVHFQNSTANNIVWPLHSSEGSEPGTMFVDSNPATPPSERFKMVLTWDPDPLLWPKLCDDSDACKGTKTRPQCCGGGQYTLVSADGIHFAPKTGADGKLRPAYQGSDSQQTGHWDPVLQKYVIFVRGHQPGAAERTVLRCVTSDVTNWTSESAVAPVCPTVLAPDGREHYLTDYYTSGATAYGPVEDGNVVFFPTPYRHFSGAQASCACPGLPDNCGIIDIRFAFSRARGAPGTVKWVPSPNGRDAVIPLGECSCCDNECGWCRTDRGLQTTSFDTGQIYSVVGYLEDPHDGSLMFYYSGMPFSHGQNTPNAHSNSTPGGVIWAENHGIGAVRYRKHGFTSIDAPATYNGWWQEEARQTLPQFTTKHIPVPNGCQAFEVFANVQTAVAGSVYIAIDGFDDYSLNRSQPIQGNSVRRRASWPRQGDSPGEVCENGTSGRSGPQHQGALCTTCSYQLPGGVCGGKYPEPLRCNTTIDCHAVDDGHCHGVVSRCNASGICADDGPLRNNSCWCVSKPQPPTPPPNSRPSVVVVPVGVENVTLTVAMVGAKLFALELECIDANISAGLLK